MVTQVVLVWLILATVPKKKKKRISIVLGFITAEKFADVSRMIGSRMRGVSLGLISDNLRTEVDQHGFSGLNDF